MSDRTARGHAVHAHTVQYEQGLLDLDEVAEAHRGYVDSFAAAFEEYRPQTLLAEQVLYLPQIEIAGTLDRLWLIDGALELTDFKAGVDQPWHKVQTAGYAYLLDTGIALRRSTWLLKANGRPAKRIPHGNDIADRAAFLAAVTCHNWRSQHVTA